MTQKKNRIIIEGKLPHHITLACSGGVDSCGAALFLSKNHKISLLYIDHFDTNTEGELKAIDQLIPKLGKNFHELVIKQISGQVPDRESREAWWSRRRKEFFEQSTTRVVTAHHLDDCVESWVFNCMNGNPQYIGYQNGNVIRPFRMTTKEAFIDICNLHALKWHDDRTNYDSDFAMRNFIRANSDIFKTINPGIRSVIRKKIMAEKNALR